MDTWLRGLALGLGIAAPVGQIGVLCIRRTLADGRLVGLVSGLGAATADMLFGAVAAFGLTAVSAALTSQRVWFSLVGGVFLLYLGLRTAIRVPPPGTHGTHGTPHTAGSDVSAGHDWRLGGAYASTLGLTLTNPATILSFAAVFAGLGLVSGARGPGTAVALVAGVFCGSALWWLILSTGVGLLRRRVGRRALRGINIVSGAVLTAFGVAALLSLLL